MSNFTLPSGASLYGNYRTRTFSDIFENAENFKNAYDETVFAAATEQLDLYLIFYLLYARYGNSSIANSDENQFRYKLFSYIFQYAPTWQKELSIQKDIRAKSLQDFQLGSTNIVNNANNPSGTPTTQNLEELLYVNAQNVSKTQRGIADGYALLLSLLKEDVTEKFVKRFQNLFLTIVAPEKPLWYENNPMED